MSTTESGRAAYETATDTTTVEVNGRPVRVRLTGPADGEPVLLIHGIARSLEDFTATQDLLSDEFRVINIDLPGFGLTRKQPGRPGLEAFARAAVGVLDALDEHRPVHVMGNSLGGAVAMTIAAHNPERVASLVLIDAAGFGREVNISPLPMVWAGLSALPRVGARFSERAREAGAQVNRDVFHDPTFATPGMIKHAGKVGRQPDFRATFFGTAASISAPVYGVRPGWRRELLAAVRRTGLPVLVVWGESDTVLPVSHLDGARTGLPDARFHLFEQTGHMPQIERAPELVALAREFIASAG